MSDERLVAMVGGIIGGALVAVLFLHLYMRAPVKGRTE